MMPRDPYLRWGLGPTTGPKEKTVAIAYLQAWIRQPQQSKNSKEGSGSFAAVRSMLKIETRSRSYCAEAEKHSNRSCAGATAVSAVVTVVVFFLSRPVARRYIRRLCRSFLFPIPTI